MDLMQDDYYGWNNSFPQGYQATSNNQPPYSYHDQSLFPTHDTLPAIKIKRFRFRLLRLGIQFCFVLLPFFGAWLLPEHFASVYNSYQQGTCTISYKDVNVVEHKDKHGTITSTSYYPRLFYTINNQNGVIASSSGYDGPSAREYSFSSDAQTVIDRYQIGQTTQCFYNPTTPTKAFIIFYGYTDNDRGGNTFWSFLVFAGFSLIAYLLFDWAIWRSFALSKRGVTTPGKSVRHEERRTKSRRYTVSIISFQALEEPARWREITIETVLPLGSQTPVCYDPFFPRYRRHLYTPDGCSMTAGVLTITVLGIIGLIILLIVWGIP